MATLTLVPVIVLFLIFHSYQPVEKVGVEHLKGQISGLIAEIEQVAHFVGQLKGLELSATTFTLVSMVFKGYNSS